MRHLYYICGARAADIAGIQPEQIGMTHLIYSFFFATKEGYLTSRPGRRPGDAGDCRDCSEYYIDPESSAALRAMGELKKRNPGLKIITAIGGGWAPPDPEINQQMIVSKIIRHEDMTERLVQGIERLCLEYSLDGIDIDYEHPTGPEDVRGLVKLATGIRAAFDNLEEAAAIAGRATSHHEISMAVNGVEQQAEYYAGCLGELKSLVDNWNIMNYDYDYGTPGTLYLVAPMRSSRVYCGGQISIQTAGQTFGKCSTMEGIMAYVTRGFPKDKINLGVPFYGRKYTIKPGTLDIVFGSSQYATREDIEYRNIPREAVEGSNGWERIYVPDAEDHYSVYRDKQGHITDMYTYNDPESLAVRKAFAEKVGLGGMMVWQYSQDTDDNSLGKAIL